MKTALKQTNLSPLNPTIARLREKGFAATPIKPQPQTLRLKCHYTASPPWNDHAVNPIAWSSAAQAYFNWRADNGQAAEPATSVRFLWTDEALWFYVEAETLLGRSETNSPERVWEASNVEFLLTPDWYAEPFANEYEFLFNTLGAYTDLYWVNGKTLEEAMAWNATGMKWQVVPSLMLEGQRPNWAFVGKVPFAAFGQNTPCVGDYWAIGLFRKVVIENETRLLAWSPPLTNPPKFHTPARFGLLVFENAAIGTLPAKGK